MDPPIAIPGVEFLGQLGRGGSCVVYRARRGGAPCAVKLASAAGKDSALFRRKAAALARVSDPGVPTVLEVGEVRGTAYLVMELVNGETLAARMARRRLSDSEVFEIGLGVARVLAAVHRRGLVHGDLSPNNIVLQESGAVRVVDFPLAPSPRNAGAAEVYAAPEQRRVPVLVDARTDLYALGAILFECATGTPPGRQVSQALAEARFDASLATLLGGLLAAAPGDRYASAAAALSDMTRVRAGDAPAGPASARDVPEALPFVGRLAERAVLLNAWGEARGNRGHAALVIGPRGSGKSRLLREVTKAIDAEVGAAGSVYVRCKDADPRPLGALRAICNRLAESVAALDPRARARAEQAVARAAGDDLAPVMRVLSPGLAARSGVTRTESLDVDAETFAELSAEFVARLARELGALAILVDDAQWLEPASTEVIARLVSRAAREPLLVVLAARTEPFGRESKVVPEEGLLRVDLGRFAGKALRRLVAAYLGREPAPQLLEWVSSVSDGTPFGVVELLDAVLASGALALRDGHWHFDRQSAERTRLPGGALELLARRLDSLPAPARSVFQTAAVLGASFEDALLAGVAGVDVTDLGLALAEARRAQLIEADSPGRHRFVHDNVREALLAGLNAEARRAVHQATAEALDRSGSANVYTLALQYAAGEPGPRPARAFEAARAAAHKAFEELDSDAALGFFEAARAAAGRAGIELDVSLLGTAGESALRLGGHAESIAHFEAAVGLSSDPVERASLLGRIAWAEQAMQDPNRAWATLERAFRELGEEMPSEKAKTMGQALLAFGRARIGRPSQTAHSARVLELLCRLHYQNARLGYEYDKPLRVLQSSLRGQAVATVLGHGPAVARARAFFGVALCGLGQRRAGWAHLERARAEALRAGDPQGEAYCMRLSAIAACFSGDFDRAVELFGLVLDQRGAWIDMHDYCLDVHTAYSIEMLRGRPREAWRLLERAIERAAPHGRGPSVFVLIAHCARATLAALDRVGSDELGRALRVPVDLATPLSGQVRVGSWGSRARYLVETDSIGSELDELVAEFRAEAIQPRRAHPSLFEYYVAVAEASVLRCLRARAVDRERHVADLRHAVQDVRALARYPLYRAHLHLAEGFLAWFEGSPGRARSRLAQAEQLADSANCSAVLFGVARARAHILKAEGRAEASRERARMALAIARDQGAVQRARWIVDELGGSWSTVDAARRSSVVRSSSSSRPRPGALFKLLKVRNGEFGDEVQARLLMDELLESVSAERGLLAFERSTKGEGIWVAREYGGRDWAGTAEARALVEEARKCAEPRARDAVVAGKVTRAVAMPLFLNDAVRGAVYLERAQAPFDDPEMDTLLALSYQIPIALELARSLAEREALELGLRRVQKMEAVGRFAGGIAHDFNNMLTAMQSSLTVAMADGALGEESRSELDIVQSAVRRASDLTRQLLNFARRDVPASDTHDLHEVLEQLRPMLQRLLGARIEVTFEPVATRAYCRLDRSLFEQSIVNLALNARDAMPDGGRLAITTADVVLDETSAEPLRGLARGTYVLVTVRDDGTGMPPEVRDSAFEPFFTTKIVGKGSGLGLSIVYGFVQQSDGTIELDSVPGQGTTFRIYLPRSADPPVSVRVATPSKVLASAPQRGSNSTVLLVEDEDLLRKSLRRMLERAGYRVLAVPDAEAALELARKHESAIDVMLSDVLLPGMLGTELAQQIREVSPRVKILLMSGHTDGKLDLPLDDLSAAFLRKPFTLNALDEAIRDLLRSAGSISEQ